MKLLFVFISIILSHQLLIAQNIGIGTTTPVSKLEVKNGELTVTSTVSSANLVLHRANTLAGTASQISFQDNGIVKWALGGPNIGAAGVNKFSIYNYITGQNVFTIDGNTNYVGIGTTSPAQKLDIANGRMRFTGAHEGGAAPGIEFTNSTGSIIKGLIGQRDDNTFGFYGFTTSAWAFNHNFLSGNTGMGADAGAAKLTIFVGAGNALEITGGIKVSGYNKPAFQLTINAANQIIAGIDNHITGFIIDNTLCNNDPNALLFVTPVASGTDENILAFSVEYKATTGRWQCNAHLNDETRVTWTNKAARQCEDISDCHIVSVLLGTVATIKWPLSGAKFNIMIIKQ